MGEIADYLINGDDCETCGQHIGEGSGFPRSCCDPEHYNYMNDANDGESNDIEYIDMQCDLLITSIETYLDEFEDDRNYKEQYKEMVSHLNHFKIMLKELNQDD